jgi:hypothetical protein
MRKGAHGWGPGKGPFWLGSLRGLKLLLNRRTGNGKRKSRSLRDDSQKGKNNGNGRSRSSAYGEG